jgi:hypothetical protein
MTPEDAIDKFAEKITRITPFEQPWYCGVSNIGDTIDVTCFSEHQLYKPIVYGVIATVLLQMIISFLKYICCRK